MCFVAAEIAGKHVMRHVPDAVLDKCATPARNLIIEQELQIIPVSVIHYCTDVFCQCGTDILSFSLFCLRITFYVKAKRISSQAEC